MHRPDIFESLSGEGNLNPALTRLLLGLIGTCGAVLVTAGVRIYRKFKHSGADDVESFRRYAAQGIKYYAGRYVRRQLAAELTLRQYARLHLQTTAREMLVPASIPVHLDVDEVFIPLLLRGSLQEQFNYTDLLGRRGQRIMILGEPGSGKSSLFKRLFRDSCRAAASTPRKAAVPVLFEMRKLSENLAVNEDLDHEKLFEILLVSLRETAVYHASRSADDLKHGGGFFILLDGIDEIPRTLSHSALNAIMKLSAVLSDSAPQSTILISSRTQYFTSLRRRDMEEAFEVLSIRPFTLGDIYAFLTRWPFKDNPKQNITRIFSRLRQLSSLTEMCTNPLALSMFVARDQQTGGTDVPDTRSGFYASLLDELIVNRRSRLEENPMGQKRLRDMRRAVLGAVCLDHILSPDEAANSIPQERFITAIKKSGYGDSDPFQTLAQLSSDTGLFAEERKGETERFLHLTICEFLAAVEIIESGEAGWSRLLPFIKNETLVRRDREGAFWESRLAEVIAFSSGLAVRSLRDRILQDLSNLKRPTMLLKAIIETQAYDDDVAFETIKAECISIMRTAPKKWDTAWFARLRTIIAILRDAYSGRRPETTMHAKGIPTPAGLLHTLIQRYDAEDRLLSTLARQDADAAIAIAEDASRSNLMGRVAAAADEFPVLQGILGRCELGVRGWQLALLESALLNENIANTLINTFSRHNLNDNAAEAKWARSYILNESVYGTLLDGVLGKETPKDHTLAPLLTELAHVKPPQSMFFSFLRPVKTQLVLLSTLGSLIVLAYIAVKISTSAYPMYRVSRSIFPFAGIFAGWAILVLIISNRRVAGRRWRFLAGGRSAAGRKAATTQMHFDLVEGRLYDRFDVVDNRNDRLAWLERNRVLREILNLDSPYYRSFLWYWAYGGLTWRMRFSAFRAGVSPAEIRCLLIIRALREKNRYALAGKPN